MALQQITANDIAGWDSLDAVASSFEKRGLKPRPNFGEENELVLQLADDEFIVLVEAGPGESATDFKPKDVDRRHTNLVATNDFESFTFLTRVRTFGQQHGQIKHQKLSFEKSQFTSESGEKNTILQKLNEIEYGNSAAIYGDLYDTKQIVNEFYSDFEDLRRDLVQEVSGIPDDRGDAKERYVQVTLDRMIFLYFIQEKRLLDHNPDYLHDQHEQVVQSGGDVYDDFYKPLFFEMLAEGKQDPNFGRLPYLNGGLFSTNPVEEEFDKARLGENAKSTNELFGRILDFLSSWNWNVDERLDIVDPKNLNPSVLGMIFEQTVNQKEMGAYYTPEEITQFMARQSVHPYLLDKLNESVGTEYETIDQLFGLSENTTSSGEQAIADGGTITQQAPTENVQQEHIEILYHDILKEIRVLDPAVGSGAFLLATQDVLLDIYLQCLEYFEQVSDEGFDWQLENRTREELDAIEDAKGSMSLHAKRHIILNNLYGVDIDDGAVEICKLRLWLSMVADIEDEPTEVEPLPNIDFNIRQGNSLIGFTEIVEVNKDGDKPLTNWGGGLGESVRDMYDDVIEAVERHRSADTGKEAANARNLAESRINSHSQKLDEKILDQFHHAGLEGVCLQEVQHSHPFHWVLEFATVYRDGGFDIVIGNPPWEVLSPNRDDYFVKFDESFRTRMPEDKDAKMKELLEDPEIEEGWENYKDEMLQRAEFFNESGVYSLQTPEVDGKLVQNENDLSMLFFERVFDLVSDDGYVTQILPGNFLNGASAKDLRDHLLNEAEVQDIVGFENRGIFSEIDSRYRFGIVTFKNSGQTETVRGIFEQTDLDVLRNIEENSFEIPSEVLERYSPKAKTFPNLTAEREVQVLQKILQHPPVSEEIEDTWYASLYAEELHRAKDSDRFVESEEEGDYPVYEGKNIFQFVYDNEFFENLGQISLWSVEEDRPEKSAKHRVRMKNFRSHNADISLKKAIYQKWDGSGSQKGFVNDLLEEHGRQELSKEDVLLDCNEYRIAIREIARATDERTLIAGVIPKGAVTAHTLHTVRPYMVSPEEEDLSNYPMHSAYERVFTDGELFAALGILNSVPFDYLMRTKVDTHIVKYKFEESQMPRLVEGDDWFEYISTRSAQLNCYGDEFAEMRERLGDIRPATEKKDRRQLQAEIDAAAFHAYGLNRRDVEFVLNDFHRVKNPRIMDEEYFDLVFEKFDELEQEGPKP
ncbi:Eco57I restriction-modification methylase domain-containing protein [Halogeometricum borinquense]|uniref:Eco57I restriction-modification methylase domain-containing protein n=1 Tax=Halogeometricum borinquense TaxID=60847 RepID=UPI0034141EF5